MPNIDTILKAVGQLLREIAPNSFLVVDCDGRATRSILAALIGLGDSRLIIEDPYQADNSSDYEQLPEECQLAIGEYFNSESDFESLVAMRDRTLVWQPELSRFQTIDVFLRVIDRAARRKVVMPHGHLFRALLHLLQATDQVVPIYPEFHLGREQYMQFFGFPSLVNRDWSFVPKDVIGFGF